MNVLKYGSTASDASSSGTKRGCGGRSSSVSSSSHVSKLNTCLLPGETVHTLYKDDQPPQEIEHETSDAPALHLEPKELSMLQDCTSSPLQGQVAGVNFGSDTQESTKSCSSNLCTDKARMPFVHTVHAIAVPANCLTECFELIKQTEENADTGTYDNGGIDFLENLDVDSDEEMARYEEIDEILETLECAARKNAKNVRWEKTAAKTFLTFALKIHEIESSFEKFFNVFTGITCSANESEPEVTFGQLSRGLQKFKIQTAEMDIEGLFEEAYENWERETESEEESEEESRKLFDSKTSTLPFRYLVSNSAKFRRIFLDMQVCV